VSEACRNYFVRQVKTTCILGLLFVGGLIEFGRSVMAGCQEVCFLAFDCELIKSKTTL
jgi:hypothetical protein